MRLELKRLELKSWLLVSAVLLLASGVSVGFLAATYLVVRNNTEPGFPEPDQPAASEVFHVTNSKIYDLLGLDQGQRTEADQILSVYFQKMKHLREEWDAMGLKMEADLLDLLDTGQREQMREIMRQIRINEVAGDVSRKLALYCRELKLTPQQEENLYPIFLADQLTKNEYFRDLHLRESRGESVEHQKVMSTLSRMGEERAEKIRPHLTGEQFAKYQEIQMKRRKFIEQKREKPPSSERKSPPES